MTTRVILLRAINVGGTARLPMAELRDIACSLGATEVTTYIQSGNLLCTPPGDASAFDRALEAAIEARYGFFREAISRSLEELETALDAHPFEVVDPKHSYVTFLAEAPTADAIEKARSYACGDDVWEVIGRDLHVRYARGAGRASIPAAVGRALGVGTARNLHTVRKLLALGGR